MRTPCWPQKPCTLARLSPGFATADSSCGASNKSLGKRFGRHVLSKPEVADELALLAGLGHARPVLLHVHNTLQPERPGLARAQLDIGSRSPRSANSVAVED